MKEIDIFKDLLHYKWSNQTQYNEDLLTVRNPEIRQILTQLRDDEMRAVVKLQQRIDRLESTPGILSRIFPTRERY